MEEGYFEDECEPSVKNEPEDILSPPMEIIVCPENQILDEDEWASRSSEQLSIDPLATNPMCEIPNESFTTDPLIQDVSSESCKLGRVDLSKSMVVSEELDLGVCQMDDEMGGTSQRTEVPQPSVNDIINLPPVYADPDPEKTRRLLDNALQKIISQVTKRKGRKRRVSQLPNDEIKQQNKSLSEFSSCLSTQQMNDCLSPSIELVGLKPKISKTTIKSRAIPSNARNTPSNELRELSQLSPDLLSAIEPSTVNQVDMVLMQGNNFPQPPAKKPRKGAKSFQQLLQSKKQTLPKSTVSRAALSTNLSPLSVPVISDVHSIYGFKESPLRATGGDPSPAGGSPEAAGANAMAEGAQEAGDSRILKTPLVGRFNTKHVSQEARPPIHVDADMIHKDLAVNLGKKKQIVKPRSQRKPNSSQRSLPSGPTPICNLCGRGFSTYCELMSHIRLHIASVRRYFCSSCKSRFGHAQALVSHVRKRHGIEMIVPSAGGMQRPFAYSCNLCDKFFVFRGELNEHLLQLHGAACSKVVKGVASALIGMPRMRGAIPKEYSDPVSRSTVLKTSSLSENQSHPLSNSNTSSDQETELNSSSCSQTSCPSSVLSYHRKLSVSDLPEFRKSALSPTSVRSRSMSSGISSSSSSNESSETALTNFPGYEINKTQEIQRYKTTSHHDCPVHSKTSSRTYIQSVKNSKYSSSKAAQLTSKSSVTKKALDVNLSDGPKYKHPLKRNSSDTGKGNNSYSQAKSYYESKANNQQQVIRDQPNTTSKIFDSRDKVPCPVHKSSRGIVEDFVHFSCSKKIILTKSCHATSSSIRKPLPEPGISLISEENAVSPPNSDCESLGSSVTTITKPHVNKVLQRAVSRISNLLNPPHPEIVYLSDCESLGSSVTSISKPNVNKVVQRAVSRISNLMNSNSLEISENINKKRYSYPSDSLLTSTNPKLQKIQTTSAGNVSKSNANPAHNKMARLPYANGNTFVSPLSKTGNGTCHASSKPTNKKRNSFPPFTYFTDPKSQKIHTMSADKSSANRRILESKNMERSSHIHNSKAVVYVKKLNGLPNFNSSTSSAQYDQPNVVRGSQTASYDSNYLANSKNKVSHTSIPVCGNPVVVLKRIDPLMVKKSQ